MPFVDELLGDEVESGVALMTHFKRIVPSPTTSAKTVRRLLTHWSIEARKTLTPATLDRGRIESIKTEPEQEVVVREVVFSLKTGSTICALSHLAHVLFRCKYVTSACALRQQVRINANQ